MGQPAHRRQGARGLQGAGVIGGRAVEQAPRRETMTQGEIDALMRHIEKGESLAGPW